MRIAIVLNTSWNIYNFRLGLVKSLLAEGHTVYAVAPKDTYSTLLEEEGCIFRELKMDSRGANPIRDMGLIFELYRIYRSISPDIVLHYTIKPNIYGSIAARLLTIPVINNVCGLGTVFMKKGLVSMIAKWMYRFSFRYPDKIFFQNEDDRNLFVSQGLVKNEISDIVPGSGINPASFFPSSAGKQRTFTFLVIARLIYDKGIVEYIQASRKLRDKGVKARFQLLGAADPQHKRGISLKLINEWIGEGVVDYLGSTRDVRKFIDQADCIVLPSYREGTPRTLLEAASMGKPLIATNVPGCNSVVTNNFNGYLCNLKDADDLADKMEKMYRQEVGTLQIMGKNSRETIEARFDEKIVINKYLSAIGQLKAS